MLFVVFVTVRSETDLFKQHTLDQVAKKNANLMLKYRILSVKRCILATHHARKSASRVLNATFINCTALARLRLNANQEILELVLS